MIWIFYFKQNYIWNLPFKQKHIYKSKSWLHRNVLPGMLSHSPFGSFHLQQNSGQGENKEFHIFKEFFNSNQFDYVTVPIF